jgi:RND superfamily putative drug exporter
VSLLGFLVGASALISLPNRLTVEAFVAPGTDSYEGRQILERDFGVSAPNLVLVISAKAGTIDSPAVASAATAVVERLRATGGVTEIASYWPPGEAASLRNATGTRGLVVGRIVGWVP